MKHIKTAVTSYPVADNIKNRWSPRSFSGEPISTDKLNTILEAATWSFSAINEQPWRYLAAQKGTPLFDQLFDALAAGNKPWNKQASAFVVSLAKTTFADGITPNASAQHDVGAANMLLTLQANSMNIYTHLMGGFDREKVSALLHLEADIVPVVIIALGYADEAEKLEEPFKTRELTPRIRKPLSEIIRQIPHGKN
jgi:nitroreductase